MANPLETIEGLDPDLVADVRDALIVLRTASSPPSTGQLIVIAGQSNAVGRGIAERVDVGLGLASNFASVQHSAEIGIATDPITWSFSISPEDLQPYTTGATQSMGVELTLGRMLFAAGREPFIGKFALNSASLAGNFLSTADYPTDPGPPNLFTQLVTYIQGAIDDSGEQLGTLVWIQGESDAGTDYMAAAYEDNLASFINDLRAEFGNFQVVVVRLNDGCTETYKDDVRAAQEAWVTGDANAILINADDLPLSDGLHYDEEEIATLGYRIGKAILDDLEIDDVTPVTFVEYVGAAPGAYGTGALSPMAYPHEHGDILILATATGLGDVASSLSTAAGYTSIGEVASSVDLGGMKYQRLHLWYLRADQTTMDGNGGQMPLPVVADTNAYNAARIFVFRPPLTLTGNPVDVSSNWANNNYHTEVSISGATTTGANRLVAIFTADFTGGDNTISALTNSDLTSITEQQDSYYLIGSDRQMITCTTGRKAVAGAYGTTTGTISNSAIIAAMTVALIP